jgi:hypothetical protein
VACGVPVREQEHQRGSPRQRDRMGGRKEPVNAAHADHREVEGPDAKNPPRIERGNVDGTCFALFAQQQFRNQVGAKKEKDADAEFSGTPDGSELSGFIEVPYQPMGNKYQQKSQGPENIEARAVETIYPRLGPLHLDDDGGGRRHLFTPGGTPGQGKPRPSRRPAKIWSWATMMHVQHLRTERTAWDLKGTITVSWDPHVHPANLFQCALPDDPEHALLGKLGYCNPQQITRNGLAARLEWKDYARVPGTCTPGTLPVDLSGVWGRLPFPWVKATR